MNATAKTAYHLRFQRVLDHIDAHLDTDLSLEAICAVAAFSRFHFHRQFAAMFGLSLHRYVQLRRLNRAAHQLAFRGASVTAAALDAGFEGPEAFARVFKQRSGQSPSAFRKAADWETWQHAYAPATHIRSHIMTSTESAFAVRIAEVGEIPVALLIHRGPPSATIQSVRRFIEWRKANGLPPKLSATYNLLYDDIETTPAQAYRFGLAAATSRDIAPNEAGVEASVIPGGRVAMLRHIGSDAGLFDAVVRMYRDWLPQSGEELRDFPIYLQRVSFFPDMPEHEAVADIFLPLK